MNGRMLRYYDSGSPIHRLWAGTKVLWLPAVGTTIAFQVSWIAIGLGWASALTIFLLARLPWGVIPRPPKLLWIAAGASVLLASIGGEGTTFYGLSLSGMGSIARFMAFAWMMVFYGLMMGWTTKLDEIASSISRLFRPLRRIGLPVTEMAATLTIAVRAVPLVADELRLVIAARRVRGVQPHQDLTEQAADVAVSLVVSTFRRSADLGRTLASRGGVTDPPLDTHRLAVIDAAAFATAMALMAIVIVVG
jgi:energy-coupling factor transporter transmembrane protein EcfT